MKIYLDDIRECPDGFVLCRTAKEAFQMIDSGKVDHISFDHDLGTMLTGYDVAVYIELQVAAGRILCPDWSIHTANPVGRQSIQAAMESAAKIEKKEEK